MTMRVEAKEAIKHHPFYPAAGDIITVPKDVGENWVQNGWAINVETGEDNEPSLTPVTLNIQNVKLSPVNTEL